jgi:Domain of unknown function (DUF397)
MVIMRGDMSGAWRKSSYSASSGNCVEVARTASAVSVRDSKQAGPGPVLGFSHAAWRAFLDAAKYGKFDH